MRKLVKIYILYYIYIFIYIIFYYIFIYIIYIYYIFILPLFLIRQKNTLGEKKKKNKLQVAINDNNKKNHISF